MGWSPIIVPRSLALSDFDPIDTDDMPLLDQLAARLDATLRQLLGREPDDPNPVIRPEMALFVGGGLVFAMVAAILVVTAEPRQPQGVVHATAQPDPNVLNPVKDDRKTVRYDDRYDVYASGGGGGRGSGGGGGGGVGPGAPAPSTPCVDDPDLLSAVRRTSGFGIISMQRSSPAPCQAP